MHQEGTGAAAPAWQAIQLALDVQQNDLLRAIRIEVAGAGGTSSAAGYAPARVRGGSAKFGRSRPIFRHGDAVLFLWDVHSVRGDVPGSA
jgi:hypothetical protein